MLGFRWYATRGPRTGAAEGRVQSSKEFSMGKDEINAFLGAGTSYQGKLQFSGTVRIDGTFKGEVESGGTLVIGKEANVEGEVRVGQMVISGHVEGEITASEKVVLHKTANLIGSLRTPVLVIEEGAVIEGQITMGTKGADKVRAKEKTPPAPTRFPAYPVSAPAAPAAAASGTEAKAGGNA